ncbi:hypothetical protein [Borreliella garinii]|uniref:hypothetical protein n=1 Tax=Borreliella garinii TaxID=29519 RepID=UPI000AFBA316|nr:hypothetical protein [Borreliella garinii]
MYKQNDNAELNNDLDEESKKLQSKSNLVNDDRVEFSKTTPLEKLISGLSLNDAEKETLAFLINSLKEKLADSNIGVNFKNTGGDENKIEETVTQIFIGPKRR